MLFWLFVMGGACMDLDIGILDCAELWRGGCLTWWWSCLSVIGQDLQELIFTSYCERDLKVNILFIRH